jgi:hypothetical protein
MSKEHATQLSTARRLAVRAAGLHGQPVKAFLVSAELRDWPACVNDDTRCQVSVFCGVRDGIDNRWYNTVRAPV